MNFVRTVLFYFLVFTLCYKRYYFGHLFFADFAEKFIELQLLCLSLLLLIAATNIESYILFFLPDCLALFEFLIIHHQFLLRNALRVELPLYSYTLSET